MKIYIIDDVKQFRKLLSDINEIKGYPKEIKAEGRNIAGSGKHEGLTIKNYCCVFQNKDSTKYGIEVCDASMKIMEREEIPPAIEEIQVQEIIEQEWFNIE